MEKVRAKNQIQLINLRWYYASITLIHVHTKRQWMLYNKYLMESYIFHIHSVYSTYWSFTQFLNTTNLIIVQKYVSIYFTTVCNIFLKLLFVRSIIIHNHNFFVFSFGTMFSTATLWFFVSFIQIFFWPVYSWKKCKI